MANSSKTYFVYSFEIFFVNSLYFPHAVWVCVFKWFKLSAVPSQTYIDLAKLNQQHISKLKCSLCAHVGAAKHSLHPYQISWISFSEPCIRCGLITEMLILKPHCLWDKTKDPGNVACQMRSYLSHPDYISLRPAKQCLKKNKPKHSTPEQKCEIWIIQMNYYSKVDALHVAFKDSLLR